MALSLVSVKRQYPVTGVGRHTRATVCLDSQLTSCSKFASLPRVVEEAVDFRFQRRVSLEANKALGVPKTTTARWRECFCKPSCCWDRIKSAHFHACTTDAIWKNRTGIAARISERRSAPCRNYNSRAGIGYLARPSWPGSRDKNCTACAGQK